VGPLYEGQQYGIAFTEGSEWTDAANKALAEMKSDGSYAEIYQKWFGALPSDSE
jgi:glutamine transport system substrate-binding protein